MNVVNINRSGPVFFETQCSCETVTWSLMEWHRHRVYGCLVFLAKCKSLYRAVSVVKSPQQGTIIEQYCDWYSGL